MTEYERVKRESHAVVAICASSHCSAPEKAIRASIDPVRSWGVNRWVHQRCFDEAAKARQRDGGEVVQVGV